MAVSHLAGKLVLGEPAIEVLALVVSALRKSRDPAILQEDLKDTRDVLNALTISGYAVITQGTIEVIKELLTESQVLSGVVITKMEK